ncbi:MAG: sulfatase-like hydrolase/transferase, partial [Candidatus Hydrogenedentes bacterium]|nr:sulfatase-like hydrolase/transferase [Candidatus Hydrogenedentota bacterium]
ERNGGALPRDEAVYGPTVFADFACDFMTRNQDGPFLLYFPMVLVHNPFVPTPDSPEWEKGDRHKNNNRHFADMMAYTDKVVGRLVDHVASLGLAEDTVFFFTGDNGTNRKITSMMGDRKIVGGKGKMTDAGTRVPLIAYWPGQVAPGSEHGGLVGFEDFFSTLLDLAGIDNYSASSLDGRSILPILRGESAKEKPWLYCHYDPRWGRSNQWRGRSARTTRYKLFADGRFYDLRNDLDEAIPLAVNALSDDARDVRKQLRAVLDDMERQGSVMSPEGAP